MPDYYTDLLNPAIMRVFGEDNIKGTQAVFHTPTGDVTLDVVLKALCKKHGISKRSGYRYLQQQARAESVE